MDRYRWPLTPTTPGALFRGSLGFCVVLPENPSKTRGFGGAMASKPRVFDDSRGRTSPNAGASDEFGGPTRTRSTPGGQWAGWKIKSQAKMDPPFRTGNFRSQTRGCRLPRISSVQTAQDRFGVFRSRPESFSIAPRNDFGWVGQIKTKVSGTPCFGNENFQFEPGICSFKPGGAVYLVFHRSRRLRTVLVFFDSAPK